ncbi:MAG: NYN domain-containing protein [Gemmataceae bacterium]|nr:NYN domain-containing protein [Gemmataceae bacterium]
MTVLIDGYNLMYAVGLTGPGLPKKGLEKARTRLLDWLADAAGGRADLLRVVFDARQGPFPSAEYGYRGVRVQFAFGQTADERIDELVHAERVPKAVVVVSNDNAVRAAGTARGCAAWACPEFVDWLLDRRPADAPAPPPEADKPADPPPADELAALLAAFNSPKRR